MKPSNILLSICIAAGFVFLSSLGFWQLQRLAWKEDLIARVEKGLEKRAVPLEKIERDQRSGLDIEYRPVMVSGRFRHDAESHYFATHGGKPGYFVYTPLILPDGRALLVNRGYVPLEVKDARLRMEGQVEGTVALEGLARSAPPAKPNTFVPDNDLAANVFYWKSLPEMSAPLAKESLDVVPLFIDAGPGQIANGPSGGVTRVAFPNSHLQYALTWFGLALALLGVGGTFLFRRIKAN